MTRDEAHAAGLKRYFTGQPCAHGHVAERYVCDKNCVECARLKLERRNAKRHVPRHNIHKAQREARRAAKAAGETLFYTGLPCVYGHDAPRRVDNGGCVECGRLSCGRQYRKDPKKYHLATAAWVTANPEKSRGHKRASDNRHREEKRARGRAYYWENLIEALDYRSQPAVIKRKRQTTRAWNKQNRGKLLAYQQNYRALLAGAPGTFTAADVEAMLEAQGYCCATLGCGHAFLRGGYHIDHKQPLSRDGTNWPHNLQLLCRSCNTSKGDKTMPEFLAWRERVSLTRRR